MVGKFMEHNIDAIKKIHHGVEVQSKFNSQTIEEKITVKTISKKMYSFIVICFGYLENKIVLYYSHPQRCPVAQILDTKMDN